MNFGELFVTFILGVAGITIGVLIFTIFKHIVTFLIVLAFSLATFGVGVVVKIIIELLDDVFNDRHHPDTAKERRYMVVGIPVIDGLRRLESKYWMSTLTFMTFIYNGQIPHNVDNLDLIEWLGLVNELPHIQSDDTISSDDK